MTNTADMPIYGKNLKKSSSLEPKSRWPWKFVCCIGYLSTTRFVQMMTVGLPWPILWEQKFVQMLQIPWPRWPRWPSCPYMVKTLKNLLRNQVLEYYEVCSNHDPGLTLTYFTARSNLVPYAFVWENGKTMYFSETIVVYDIKVGRWS